jgi:acetyl-CoA carboxylase biotin carboxyl carrier protein
MSTRFWRWLITSITSKCKERKGNMQIEEIRAIVELMTKHNLSEFNVEAENMRLSLKRGVAGVQGIPSQIIPPSFAPIVQIPQQQTPAATEDFKSATASSTTRAPENKTTVDAPIVGTFYASPGPEVQPFVKVGDKVTPDTVVCIIEAMKVMNEIKAEKNGIVREILVKNAQSVEYGCPLFVLE